MDIKKFKEIVATRRQQDEEQYEASPPIEKCWRELTDVLSEDIASTIKFMMEECTAEEFSYISEVFDFVVEKTQSVEFLDCIKFLAARYPEDAKRYHYDGCIEFAELALIREDE